MTSYGGFGISIDIQFSVFVAFLMERGCLFELPNFAEVPNSDPSGRFGQARIARSRFDDFSEAARWLIDNRSDRAGRARNLRWSNSGLLGRNHDDAGARIYSIRSSAWSRCWIYSKFITSLMTRAWKEEFGTADDPRIPGTPWNYSPYHSIRNGISAPQR